MNDRLTVVKEEKRHLRRRGKRLCNQHPHEYTHDRCAYRYANVHSYTHSNPGRGGHPHTDRDTGVWLHGDLDRDDQYIERQPNDQYDDHQPA